MMNNNNTLYLIRHAHAESDGIKRYIGQTDKPLSEKGVRQARKLKQFFADISLSRIVSSDLKRAADTARIIAGKRSVPLERLPVLREIHLGEWESRSFEEIRKQHPDSYHARGKDIAGYRPPGGESFSDLADRVVPAAKALISDTQGDMLIVAHAGVNRVFLCHLLGIPLKNLFRIGQNNGGVNIIRGMGTERRVIRFNMTPSWESDV